jgi:hypothetical protein
MHSSFEFFESVSLNELRDMAILYVISINFISFQPPNSCMYFFDAEFQQREFNFQFQPFKGGEIIHVGC